MVWRTKLAGLIVASALVCAGSAGAGEAPIAVGEVTSNNTDATGSLRDAAEVELRQIDASKLPPKKHFVVSLALTHSVIEGPVACTVNAMLRDAKTGNMIAIIEAGAQADGPGSVELRRQVADAAVRRAMRRIPNALASR